MQDVAIDTSSLSNALNDRPTLDLLSAKISGGDFRLVISTQVLDEVAAGSRADKVRSRARSLADLWKALTPGKLTVSAPIYRVATEELRRTRTSVPTLSSKAKKVILANLERYDPEDQRYAEIVSGISETVVSKDNALEADKSAAKAAEDHLALATPEQVQAAVNFMKAYDGPSNGHAWFLEAMLKTYDPLDINLLVSMQSIRQESRYRALRPFLALTELTMTGAALSKKNVVDEVVNLFGVRRNNAYDNAITAVAAYADIYVDDDADSRMKAQFLVDHGIARFSPVGLKDFLEM